MAELMLGQPLFPGESGIDQLVEIIKVLGTPTRDQIKTMNPNVSWCESGRVRVRVECDGSAAGRTSSDGAECRGVPTRAA